MASLAVLADDFTGCTDAEIQLLRFPVRTLSLLPHARLESYLEAADVVLLDTEARAASSPDAYQATRAAASRLVASGVYRIFKKVDSTFRGHIGSELDAVMDALRCDFCALVPAYPANGRTTRSGCHYVRGQRLSETEFARDPAHPIRESSLVVLLRGRMRRPVGNLFIEAVRAGPENLAAAMDRERERGVQVVLLDAETDRDLECIALALRRIGRLGLVAGSAAMLSAAFEKMPVHSTRPPPPGLLPGPTLVICGSLHPASARQIDTFATGLHARICFIRASRLFSTSVEREKERARILAEASDALEQGHHAALTTGLERLTDLEGNAGPLSSFIGEVAHLLAERHTLRNFFGIGGWTSLAICSALGLEGIQVYREIEPGIALCRSIGGPCELHLGLKPGGFGSDMAVLEGVRQLSSHPV
ncbi:MAG: four-carbon acid sugar kinase family protein [Planctomycetes bacterium]|nr:four-carbon acid sugar kinase family protein [Planctomycetota bacterium]